LIADDRPRASANLVCRTFDLSKDKRCCRILKALRAVFRWDDLSEGGVRLDKMGGMRITSQGR
jgi:hypothetical protein